MIEIKVFNELAEIELNKIIEEHYRHWVQYNPLLDKEEIVYKFKQVYTSGNMLPFGIALCDNEELIGFCTLRKENLKKYPEITPWISSVMIFEPYRKRGYGKKLIEEAMNILGSLGYKQAYLWTDQAPDFYKGIGFQFVQMVEKNEGGFGELYTKSCT